MVGLILIGVKFSDNLLKWRSFPSDLDFQEVGLTMDANYPVKIKGFLTVNFAWLISTPSHGNYWYWSHPPNGPHIALVHVLHGRHCPVDHSRAHISSWLGCYMEQLAFDLANCESGFLDTNMGCVLDSWVWLVGQSQILLPLFISDSMNVIWV